MILFSLLFYGIFARFREQACTFICPYGRLQSTVLDENSIVVAYDYKRGEKRDTLRRGQSLEQRKAAGSGDCIDCHQCVSVCPTGIDIRNGLQYECIGCAACVDACDGVMDKMNYPRGLIRFTTQNGMAHGWNRSQIWRHVLRPRVLIYGAVLLALCAALLGSLVVRTPLKVDVVRDRAALSRIVAGGKLENVYRLQIMNATEQPQRYRISAEGLQGLVLASDAQVAVGPAESRWVAVRLQVPYGAAAPGSHPIYFTVTAVSGQAQVSEESAFLVPR